MVVFEAPHIESDREKVGLIVTECNHQNWVQTSTLYARPEYCSSPAHKWWRARWKGLPRERERERERSKVTEREGLELCREQGGGG